MHTKQERTKKANVEQLYGKKEVDINAMLV